MCRRHIPFLCVHITTLFAVVCFSLFGRAGNVDAAVVFEDNFDSFISGWSPSIAGDGIRFFPWSTNGAAYPPGTGGYGGLTNYEPSSVAAGSRTNANSWNGWSLSGASYGKILSIETAGGRNNSPALRIRYPKIDGLTEDTGLWKWLGPSHHQEIYIRYFVKYGTDTNWRWNGSVNPKPPGGLGILWKQLRIWSGVNAEDYDNPAQTLPAENSVFSNESNWRYGVWVPRVLLPGDWGPNGHPFVDVHDHWYPLSCVVSGSSQCDSQNCPLQTGTQNCNLTDWEQSPTGWLTTYFNSENTLDAQGRFTAPQSWHSFEWHFKNNSSPGIGDGLLEVWIDGNKSVNPTWNNGVKASMSTDPDDYGINMVEIGGNSFNLTSNIPDGATQDFWIDDFVISTTYIGQDYVIGGGEDDTTAPTSPSVLTVH